MEFTHLTDKQHSKTCLFVELELHHMQHGTGLCCVTRFLLGPPNMTDKSNIGRIPKVHLSTSNSADEPEECSLIVYRLYNATICLLVEGKFYHLLVASQWNKLYVLLNKFDS